MNVQHLESVAPSVQRISGITVRETVPDWVMKRVREVVMADLTPEALQTRMRRGDIYPLDRAEKAYTGKVLDALGAELSGFLPCELCAPFYPGLRLPVPLTTVRVPFPQIAANALELLRDAGTDNPPRTLIAAPTLIPRKSATPPR